MRGVNLLRGCGRFTRGEYSTTRPRPKLDAESVVLAKLFNVMWLDTLAVEPQQRVERDSFVKMDPSLNLSAHCKRLNVLNSKRLFCIFEKVSFQSYSEVLVSSLNI